MDLAETQLQSNHPLPMSRARSFGPKRIGRFRYPGEDKESLGDLATKSPSTVARARNPGAIPNLEDPWTRIVSGLLATNGSASAARRASALTQRPCRAASGLGSAAPADRDHDLPLPQQNVRVSFVERFGARTVSLTWHDSTQACYGEQRWIRKIARSSGRCALTGMAVNRGDTVYSPASRPANRPLNSTQMILSSTLEGLEIESVASCPADFG